MIEQAASKVPKTYEATAPLLALAKERIAGLKENEAIVFVNEVSFFVHSEHFRH